MRLLIVALAALPLGAAAAEPPLAGPEQPPRFAQLQPQRECPELLAHPAERPKAQMRKLAELPPADAFHAVYRRDGNGCIDPVMVGYQYGRR